MTQASLIAYIVIATKGRGEELKVLSHYLSHQTVAPERIIFVGTEESDFGGLKSTNNNSSMEYLLSPIAGSSRQRNIGLERVLEIHGNNDNFIILYFDDDFRPKPNWVERALECFSQQDIAGLTGQVLADGIHGLGVSEEDAKHYLSGAYEPNAHWTDKFHDRQVENAYGCNMAFSAEVCRDLRFDETLPAYGWLEDKDYSLRSKKYGLVICTTQCQGVHLGTKRGRVSETKFGYSQIANPIYLMRKGSLPPFDALELALGNFIANHVKAFFSESWIDRKGRVKGNWIAILDLFKRKLSPLRINDL